tara:strand:+ start:484 stop:633 length:150 start_codon:yes stop_codon:yes gene_type:complete
MGNLIPSNIDINLGIAEVKITTETETLIAISLASIITGTSILLVAKLLK